MIKLIKDMHLKYKEIINYLICGGLSTVVNFVSYYVFARIFNIDEVISSSMSWVAAVIFAYVVNKIFVFESKTDSIKELAKEFASFIACRIISGITCDIGTFALMVKVLNMNDIVSKIVTQVMVIILNYVFSKLVIFKKRH